MSFPYSPQSPDTCYMDPGRQLPPIKTVPGLLPSDRPDTPPRTPAEPRASHKRRRSQSVGAEDSSSSNQASKVPRIDSGAPQVPSYAREPLEASQLHHSLNQAPSHSSLREADNLDVSQPTRSAADMLHFQRPEHAPREQASILDRLPLPRPLLDHRPLDQSHRTFQTFEGDPSRTLPPLDGSRRMQGSQPASAIAEIPRIGSRGSYRPWEELRAREVRHLPSYSAGGSGTSSFSTTPMPVLRGYSSEPLEPTQTRTSYALVTRSQEGQQGSEQRGVELQRSPVNSAPEDTRQALKLELDTSSDLQAAGTSVDERVSDQRGQSLPPSAGYGQYTWETSGAPSDQMHRRRRGNLPKEATAVLNDWFNRHNGYPYPKEEEKQQLQAQTGLSMSQISNWFINARRRRRPGLLSRRPDGLAGPSP